MASYADNFIDSKGKNKNDWRIHKNAINNVYSYIKVKLYNQSCYQHTKYIVCQFYQEYYAPGKLFKGIKRLYITNTEHKIISEEFINTSSVSYLGYNK